jgi:hypothetical protein
LSGGIVVSSQGSSGGITTLWDEHIWTLEVTLETQSWLLTVLKNKDFSNIISVITVYMPNPTRKKPLAGTIFPCSKTPLISPLV